MRKNNKDLWDRSKDGDRKERRSFLRYAIVASVLFILFLFIKKDNVITWISSFFTLSSQRRQIEQLNTNINDLDKKIERLKENRDSLEMLARESYLFAEPGDDVYVIDK